MLTVAEAAERLMVSPSTVYDLCTARRLEHHRVGLGRGKILISEPALEKYLKGTLVTVDRAPQPKVVAGDGRDEWAAIYSG
jgi:excisionase family DNA binding protein